MLEEAIPDWQLNITRNLGTFLFTCIIMCFKKSYSAAFDTVDHDIPLDILKCKFGIDGKALKWFDSYLRPWSFKVVIDGTCSEEQDLTVSVQQGSCAGANIFNLYCAPLEEVITPSLKISGFADDHSI